MPAHWRLKQSTCTASGTLNSVCIWATFKFKAGYQTSLNILFSQYTCRHRCQGSLQRFARRIGLQKGSSSLTKLHSFFSGRYSDRRGFSFAKNPSQTGQLVLWNGVEYLGSTKHGKGFPFWRDIQTNCLCGPRCTKPIESLSLVTMFDAPG